MGKTMALIDIVKSVGDGKHSLSKWTQLIAFLVSSGVIGWYAYKLELSEWMFTAYFTVAVGANIINKKIATDKDTQDKKIDAGIDPETKP
jgi:hypothetical protein